MNILDLLQADGNVVKRVAATKGGEYAGPCPFCGGNDRFRTWPEQGEYGKWWCRQCGRHGDALQYLIDYRKMNFREAAKYVGKEISSFTSSLSGRKATHSHQVPRETTAPTDLWQERARRLAEESENWLFHHHTFAQAMLGWLKEHRGLSEETIKEHRLGLVLIDRFEGHEQWGLEPVFKDDGNPRKIWMPRGLTIPLFQDEKIYRIRIRRPKFALRSERDPRYYLLRGSDTRAMILGTDKPVSIIVESELDALLLYQEAGGIVNVISLGNVSTRPDQQAADLLNSSRLILVALDFDQAGAIESWRWWRKHFRQAYRWPPTEGKDPGDMLTVGVNIWAWVKAGLTEYKDVAAQPEHPVHLARAEEELIVEEHHETAPPPTPVTLSAVPATTSPDLLENTFTCFNCSHFRPAVSPNPIQAWGRCEKRKRGRFGCATACRVMGEAHS